MANSCISIGVQNLGSVSDLNEFAAFLDGDFKMKHVRNKLLKLEGTKNEPLMSIFQGPTTLFYQTDSAKLVSSVKKLLAAEKKFPNILVLGGMVEGSLASSFDLQPFLGIQDKVSVQGAILPYLNAPSNIIPVLSSNNNRLIRVLEHIVKQKEGSASQCSAQTDAAAAPIA